MAGNGLSNSRIPKVELPPMLMEGPLYFSFKYLADDSNPKFLASKCGNDFLLALLSEIKTLSRGTVYSLCYDQGNSHQLNFEQTSEPFGFGLEEQIEPEYPWQFGLQNHPTWRVHGFLLGDTFYVVWLDPSHQLHPRAQML